MRLGILLFRTEGSAAALLTESLRADDHDVVLPESDDLGAEADRLVRADCDGVLFFVGANADSTLVARAALHLNCPLLLSGPFGPAFFEAAGALNEIGIPFERAPLLSSKEADFVAAWLRESAKTERQRGSDAARALYGQRLALGGISAFLDPAQWMSQFGVLIERGGGSDAPPADFSASDGDANGALTLQLLRLVSGNGPVATAIVADLPGAAARLDNDLPAAASAATVARITRRSGRFVGVLGRGIIDGRALQLDAAPARLRETLAADRLHVAPGEHVGALRAAFETLNIEAIVL